MRGAWIEMPCTSAALSGVIRSLPVRGAWIEMLSLSLTIDDISVAPRAGSVD